jgi:hypothetical protein
VLDQQLDLMHEVRAMIRARAQSLKQAGVAGVRHGGPQEFAGHDNRRQGIVQIMHELPQAGDFILAKHGGDRAFAAAT